MTDKKVNKVTRDPRANSVKETSESRAASPGRTRVSLRDQKRLTKLFGLELAKGWFYKVVNDDYDKNRIHTLLERGYEFVKATGQRGAHNSAAVNIGDPTLDDPNKMSSYVRTPVDRNPDGSVMYGYLMRIKEEYKAEDDAFKEERNVKRDKVHESWQQSNEDFYKSKRAKEAETGVLSDPRTED